MIPPRSFVLAVAEGYRGRARFARQAGRRKEAARCHLIADRLVEMHDADVLSGVAA